MRPAFGRVIRDPSLRWTGQNSPMERVRNSDSHFIPVSLKDKFLVIPQIEEKASQCPSNTLVVSRVPACCVGRFLISSSLDKGVKLWSDRGALVGTFGVGAWRIDDPGSWKEQEIKPLEVSQGEWDRQAGCLPPFAL